MFRKMRRFKQQISEEECKRVLREAPRGVIAVLGDEDFPYAVPVDYYYCETDGHIYIHGAAEGHRPEAIRRHDKVSFCVMDSGYHEDGDWALKIRSVVVFGRMHEVTDPDQAKRQILNIGFKYYPDPKEVYKEYESTTNRVHCYEIVPEYMSGKLVREA